MKTSFKEQCIALRKEGYSIIEIMKATGRAKSSVRTHIKDIPLSRERLEEIKKVSGERIRKFAMARKGKSVRPFKPFKQWNEERVSLASHFLFDGGIYPRSGCTYNNRSEALVSRVEEHMCSVYDFEPTHYTNSLTGVLRISYHNVALAIYMKNKMRELLQNVRRLSLNLKTEFVRAFFDDEGCIDYRPEKNRRSVRGYQKDVKILRLIQALLKDLEIESRVILPNEVIIVGRDNLTKFERKINFSPGVYMNGNRSNSRWKKHMEKKELLRRAIRSFKN
ncbi:MAG: LAGLIDADG family homing endonuclease [bacterium]|nr:LAGLIDADG family homing endonuclease [bacterium]